MKVVAVSGWKFSGKDTVANYLVDNHGYKRVSFADPLKDMVAEQFSIPRNYLDDPMYKESPLFQYPAPATDGFTSMISNFIVREFRTEDGFPADVKSLRNQEGILQTFLNGWENLYHTPRSLAILVGSGMRSGDPSFWVNKAIKTMLINNNQNYVISDLRYRSEVGNLLKAFGKDLVTIRVNRFDASPSTDPSENDLNEWLFDFHVTNKGTKEELFTHIKQLLS